MTDDERHALDLLKLKQDRMRLVMLHFDNTLSQVDALPRHLQITALSQILNRVAAKLETYTPYT